MACYFDQFIVTEVIAEYITDFSIIIVSAVLVFWLIIRNSNLKPSRTWSILDLILDHWDTITKENLGDLKSYFAYPLIISFLFLIHLNLLGFFMYTIPPTTHIILTFGFALVVWLGIILLGLISFKGDLASTLMPTGAPLILSPFLILIEIASNLSRPIALGMRLAANITAGHILLAILSDFSFKLLNLWTETTFLYPALIIIFMVILEIGVMVIQAYVFNLLLLIYLKDSVKLH